MGMTIIFDGYWTLVHPNGQALMTFANRAAAQALLDDIAGVA